MSPEQSAALCSDWNVHYPVGTKVRVLLDDGSTKETVTRIEAWVLGGHTAVIMLEGISGAFALQRVTPAFS